MKSRAAVQRHGKCGARPLTRAGPVLDFNLCGAVRVEPYHMAPFSVSPSFDFKYKHYIYLYKFMGIFYIFSVLLKSNM